MVMMFVGGVVLLFDGILVLFLSYGAGVFRSRPNPYSRIPVKRGQLSFGCGALFNALSIRNPDFLIFAFRFLILIPA
jgi:hypothetical protein